MKKHITGLLAFVFLFLFVACKEAPEPDPTFLTIGNRTDKNIICGYYIGPDKNFLISAEYLFTCFPQTIYFVNANSGKMVVCFFAHDGKDKERTYQFIFFDGETLDKYTLEEIAERNLYDDL